MKCESLDSRGSGRHEIYHCPGDRSPVSRSVHLARLANFHTACHDCPHRHDTDVLSSGIASQIERAERRGITPMRTTRDGVRGVHRNSISRTDAARLALQFASGFWSEGHAPRIVVACDERPNSTDLLHGVIEILRETGCSVVDIGIANRPLMQFAVRHVRASAGILITGSDHGPAWTGFDLFVRQGRPIGPEALSRLVTAATPPPARPTRSSGGLTTASLESAYTERYLSRLHVVRPLVVCLATSRSMDRKLITRLLTDQPCQIHWVELPVRARKLDDEDDVDIRRASSAVRKSGAHLGFVLAEGGHRCAVLENRGRLAEPLKVANWLGISAAPHASAKSVGQCVPARDVRVISGSTSPQAAMLAIDTPRDIIGLGVDGEFWLRTNGHIECDAVATLSEILTALSRSNTRLSQLLAQSSTGLDHRVQG